MFKFKFIMNKLRILLHDFFLLKCTVINTFLVIFLRYFIYLGLHIYYILIYNWRTFSKLMVLNTWLRIIGLWLSTIILWCLIELQILSTNDYTNFTIIILQLLQNKSEIIIN